MANSRFRVDNFRSYRGSQGGKAASQHHSNPSPTSRYPTPPSITKNSLPSFSLPPSPPYTHPPMKHISPVQTHPPALIHPLPARPPAEVCAHTRAPRSPLSLSPTRDLESPKEPSGQPAGSAVVTASTPATVTPGLQEAQTHQSSANSDRHDTGPSTIWHEMFDVDDIVIDEITPHPEIERGPDSSSIPYFAQLDAAIPIDPAILGDTIGAPTYDWQGGGGDGDFSPSEDLLRERSSPRGNWRTFEPEPGNQAIMLGAIPSHELLDAQRYPSHGSHITEPETTVVPDVIRAVGNASEDMTSDKRGSPSEYGSDRPFKRVRTGTTSSEDTCLPLLPPLCSQFLETPLDRRLEFLSWLFESALARCTSALPTAPAPSLDRAQSKEPKRRQVQHSATTTSKAGRPAPRRRKRWEPEEIKLLVKLRGEEKRPWSEVVERFREQFPERKAASIQMYWSTKLKDEQEKTREKSDSRNKSVAVVIPIPSSLE